MLFTIQALTPLSADPALSRTSFNTALKQLIRKESLRVDGDGNYRLTDPIFRRWIAGKKV
jgi:hypothetical protein